MYTKIRFSVVQTGNRIPVLLTVVTGQIFFLFCSVAKHGDLREQFPGEISLAKEGVMGRYDENPTRGCNHAKVFDDAGHKYSGISSELSMSFIDQ